MTDVVFVGCKMPNGVVLHLRHCQVIDKDRQSIRVVGNDKPEITLKGTATRQGVPDLSINGYVFTPVPAAFWIEWMKLNKDSSLLADGFIMAAKTEADMAPMAAEMAKRPGQNTRIIEKDPRTSGLGVAKYDPDDIAA